MITVKDNIQKLIFYVYPILFSEYWINAIVNCLRYQTEGSPTLPGPSPPNPCFLQDVQLRFLCPDDLEEVKFLFIQNESNFRYTKYNIFQVRTLCRDWFPIEYPLSWYKDITSSERFFALAAVHQGLIIGLIVAEIKPYLKLNAEDRGILPGWFGTNNSTLVGYILSLGVARSHRRAGIGSLLLETLISHVAGPTPLPPYHHRVKALFLHVLLTNSEAILFYEQRKYVRSYL